MRCQDLTICFEQINGYSNGTCTGFPLIVNTNSFRSYQEIAQRLHADESKHFVHVSEHAYKSGLPNPQEALNYVKGSGSYVLSGLSQGLMLQGTRALDLQIDELINCSISGHAIILLSHCKTILEKYMNNDLRLRNRIVLLDDELTPLPQIRLAKDETECVGKYDKDMRTLLSHLERITDEEIARHPVITVVTSFSATVFKNSMYAILQSGGIYDTLIGKYGELATSTDKSNGTDEEWIWLFEQLKSASNFSSLILAHFGTVSNLVDKLGDILDQNDQKEMWLLWLAMKVFDHGDRGYISFSLSHSISSQDLVHHLYQDLLDVRVEDHDFEQYYQDRKRIISRLPENLVETSSYCKGVGRNGKDAVFYLTDLTEDEQFTFMEAIDHYTWTDEELNGAISHAFPELALYMRDFVFNTSNTILSEKDAEFRNSLTEYFHRYKAQKIKNHIEDDFLNIVHQNAEDRPFFKLQPRSSFVKAMKQEGVQVFFFDALGVEYLPYIQAKCDEYGLVYEISIAHCELPSITSKNKEFQQRFKTKDIKDLDELKHHSTIYDYETCPYPIHLFKELEIIDHELRRIRKQLFQSDSLEQAIILSDHGASRLAVIYQHENDSTIELEEKGQHSGRCCPCAEGPNIPEAIYEDGFAVLGNYERFKGSRKANLEVHGGASLEEVVVPIIILSRKPENVVYYFVDPVIKFKINQPSTIELFCNVPMKEPRIEVEGTFYDGVFTSDTRHAVFTLTEQKRVREYQATIYEGNKNTGVTLPFRIERGTKTRDLFG